MSGVEETAPAELPELETCPRCGEPLDGQWFLDY